VLSEACAALVDYPIAWERCRRMIRIGRSFGRTGVFAGQDFGPLPILVAAADAPDVRGFVDESVGALIAHDREHGTPYLETLFAYLREGCRSQACADAIGLHVTTLRYRLSRMEDLFGIRLDTPEQRFAVELAIRLSGIIDSRTPTAR
ncbi:PucR family transcriptional regulator, partial [Mesorhizobium sp. M7A.T.Ca.TU.009.01.3.1]